MASTALKFYKGNYANGKVNGELINGAVVFDNNSKSIWVGGTQYGSNLLDANYDVVNHVLTITKKTDTGTASISLDFDDFASAGAVGEAIAGLDSRIQVLETFKTNMESGSNSVDSKIASAIDELAGSADNGNNDLIKVTVTTANGEVSTVAVDDTALDQKFSSYSTTSEMNTAIAAEISDLDATVSNTVAEDSDTIRVTVAETDGKLVSVTVDQDALNTTIVNAAKTAEATSVSLNAVTGLSSSSNTVQKAIAELAGNLGDGGSVTTQIATAITDLDADVTSTASPSGITVRVVEQNGEITSVVVDESLENEFDELGAASTAQTNAITAAESYTDTEIAKLSASNLKIGGNGTDKDDTIATTLASLKQSISNVDIPEYSITKAADADAGFIATYQLTKDGSAVGTKINIPKDFLVKNAELKTGAASGNPAGVAEGDKYIDFTINTLEGDGTATHLYLNVKDLVDAYAVDNTTSINLSMTNNHITAVLNDNAVTTAKIDDGAVTTAKIAATAFATISKDSDNNVTGYAADGLMNASDIKSYVDTKVASAENVWEEYA